MVSDKFETSIQSNGDELADLRRQIKSHEEHDESKSYLGRAISFVWGKDEQSLARLQDLQRQTESAQQTGDTQMAAKLQTQIADQVTADRKEVELQDEINHYAGGFLKTGALFLRGRMGLAGTIGVYALDQMNPRDSLKTQLTDMTLGMAKGGLTKGAFHLVGQKDVPVALKGVGLGITSRVLDLGLTRSTYMTPNGEFSLGTGLSNTVFASLNRTSMATDAIVFLGAQGLLKGADSLAGGAIGRSPLLTTMLTGTTFGIANGATGEVSRQQSAGESFDPWKVVQRSLLQGALDTIAAAPGGLQARGEALRYAEQMRRERDLSGSSSREFVVTKGQDVLRAFDGLDQSTAWLKVREVLGQSSDGRPTLGVEKPLLVQHRTENRSALDVAARQLELIATCNPEQLDPASRAKHVFASGQGPVWMAKTAAGDRIVLSLGETPASELVSSYESVLRLGRENSPRKQSVLEHKESDEPGSAVRRVEQAHEAEPARGFYKPDRAQLDLRNATLEYLGQEKSGESKIELYRFRATLPDGTSMDVVFRPADVVEKSQVRFRKEGAGYQLSQLIGFDNGFPVTIDRPVEVNGTMRPGWLQEWAGQTLAEALPEMARAKYPGKPVNEAVIALIESDSALRIQLEQAFAERLIYGVEDLQEWNMLAIKEGEKVKIQNIDFDFSFTSDKKPQWGTDDDAGLADVIRDQFFAGKKLSDLTRGKIRVFVDGYNTPQGRKSLMETGLTAQEIEAMMARAGYLASTGKFPRFEAREKLPERPLTADYVEIMRSIMSPTTFEKWQALMRLKGRLSA